MQKEHKITMLGACLLKEERMPDGQTKLILKDKDSGKIIQKYITEE